MNLLNRIVVIVLVLAALAGAVIVLLVTYGVLTARQVLPGGLDTTALGAWLASFATMPPDFTLITTLGALAILVVGLALLYFELRPPAQMDTIQIRQDGLGTVTVRTASIHDLIQYTAAQMPSIMQVQPKLDMDAKGIAIHCRASLSPDASIPQVSAELQDRIKRAVEQHLGMKVAAVTMQTQLEPLGGVEPRPRPARRQLR